MCRFVESLCVIDGKVFNSEAHQERVNGVFKRFFPGADILDLEKIPFSPPENGKWKWRIEYDGRAYKSEFISYKARKISSIKLIEINFSYEYKYADRSTIDESIKTLPPGCAAIFIKNGYATDCSFANLALYDGLEWQTPHTPLLRGARRQLLLNKGRIVEKPVKASALAGYQRISFINAMLDLDESSLNISPETLLR